MGSPSKAQLFARWDTQGQGLVRPPAKRHVAMTHHPASPGNRRAGRHSVITCSCARRCPHPCTGRRKSLWGRRERRSRHRWGSHWHHSRTVLAARRATRWRPCPPAPGTHPGGPGALCSLLSDLCARTGATAPTTGSRSDQISSDPGVICNGRGGQCRCSIGAGIRQSADTRMYIGLVFAIRPALTGGGAGAKWRWDGCYCKTILQTFDGCLRELK